MVLHELPVGKGWSDSTAQPFLCRCYQNGDTMSRSTGDKRCSSTASKESPYGGFGRLALVPAHDLHRRDSPQICTAVAIVAVTQQRQRRDGQAGEVINPAALHHMMPNLTLWHHRNRKEKMHTHNTTLQTRQPFSRVRRHLRYLRPIPA